MNELKKCIYTLVEKAASTSSAIEALQFSQAACNTANAMAQLQAIDNKKQE